MNYTDSDVQAIVDTKTEQLQKEISLLKEEYEVLKKTSEQIEEDQAREIYELQQKITKAIEYVNKPWGLADPEDGEKDHQYKTELLNILREE